MKKNLCFFLFILLPLYCFAEPPTSFYQAKKVALNLFSPNHPFTLYCNCTFTKDKRVNLTSCNMESAKNHKRANRIEFEHMMPAENFGKHFNCWREKLCVDKKGKWYRGRRCCKKINPTFKKAEAELYNLWPAVGVINQLRSNYRFSLFKKQALTYGCNITISKEFRKVEPDDRVKGIVARANLFMSVMYHINLSKQQKKLFELWNKQYPPTDWEKQWSRKIARIEGYYNPFIELYDRK